MRHTFVGWLTAALVAVPIAAQERLRAADAQVTAARQALTASQQRYRVGAATLLEVTQARATLTQAESALVSARYDVVFQRTRLAYAAGDIDARHATLG